MAISMSATRGATLRKTTGASAKSVVHVPGFTRRARLCVRADAQKPQAVQAVNGDPFVGSFETPVTSAPTVATFLSQLPAYRSNAAPLLRGVEIGLVHGFFITGPFIKLGPLRNISGVAEKAGCLSSAGLVLILTICLSIYGSAAFQQKPKIGLKTLSGRSIERDPLQSSKGWSDFTGGWFIGGISGVAWAYILTQTLPFYS